MNVVESLIDTYIETGLNSDDPSKLIEATQAKVANKLYGIGRWYMGRNPWYLGGGTKLVAPWGFIDNDEITEIK